MLSGMLLDNRVAIVTGGDSGIGHAICLTLAKSGAAVTINYHRDLTAAEATLAAIKQADGKAQMVQGDVSQLSDIQKLIEQTVAAFGKLDIVVNDVGMETSTSLFNSGEHQFDLVMGVDLKAPFSAHNWRPSR